MKSTERATKVLRLSAMTMLAGSGSLFATQEARADYGGCDSKCNVVTTSSDHCCTSTICSGNQCVDTYYRYN